jgi:hypothetical protein
MTAADDRARGQMYDELAELCLTLPEAELEAEVVALAGVPAETEILETQAILTRAAKDFRQRYLRAAAAEYKARIKALSTRWVDLPDSPADRRALLSWVFTRHPAMEAAFLTIQHREFKELTDGDVESCLMQLADLGVLDQKKDDEA